MSIPFLYCPFTFLLSSFVFVLYVRKGRSHKLNKWCPLTFIGSSQRTLPVRAPALHTGKDVTIPFLTFSLEDKCFYSLRFSGKHFYTEDSRYFEPMKNFGTLWRCNISNEKFRHTFPYWEKYSDLLRDTQFYTMGIIVTYWGTHISIS